MIASTNLAEISVNHPGTGGRIKAVPLSASHWQVEHGSVRIGQVVKINGMWLAECRGQVAKFGHYRPGIHWVVRVYAWGTDHARK